MVNGTSPVTHSAATNCKLHIVLCICPYGLLISSTGSREEVSFILNFFDQQSHATPYRTCRFLKRTSLTYIICSVGSCNHACMVIYSTYTTTSLEHKKLTRDLSQWWKGKGFVIHNLVGYVSAHQQMVLPAFSISSFKREEFCKWDSSSKWWLEWQMLIIGTQLQ